MSKRIFKAICIVACIVLVVSVSLTVGVLYTHFERELNDEMKSEAQALAYVMDKNGLD